MYRHLLAAAVLLLLLVTPTSANAFHTVKHRRTDYGGTIFVEHWTPILGQYISPGLAIQIRRAYKECIAADQDQNCRVMFDRMNLIDQTHWSEPDEHGVSHPEPIGEHRPWALHVPRNIAAIGEDVRMYAFYNKVNMLGYSMVRWLAQQEGLQTRTGTVVWVGPANAVGEMSQDFNCMTGCMQTQSVVGP